MSDNKTGGPALPTTKPLDSWGDPNQGMTLRDYFAAKAMQALAGGASWRDFDYLPKNGYSIVENNALLSYQMADAMLKARDEVKP